ncbi:MAG: CPBP family intramembrane glutamic endopeptidase [Anaerolineales bacterium]|jgi:membrane protease YdiL (CAAX protease family)
MKTKTDIRRIVIFLGFAFGIAWMTGLIIYLNGGIAKSRQIAPGVTLAVILLATGYMWAPALANVLTRLVTREGWKDVWLRPNFRKGWPFWVVGWFLPALMTFAGAALFFVLFPRFFDPTLSYVRSLLAQSPSLAHLSPRTFVALELLGGALAAPLPNALATFGEEFGWRAYLQPRLMPLGGRAAVVLIGLIWGIWHWPVILMGYEYGFGYPGFPWTGLLLFLWFTVCLATFQGWLTLRGKSVWPAVIGHGATNGIAAAAVLVTQGHPIPLLGPLPVGIIGSLGFALVAAVIFFSPKALEP